MIERYRFSILSIPRLTESSLVRKPAHSIRAMLQKYVFQLHPKKKRNNPSRGRGRSVKSLENEKVAAPLLHKPWRVSGAPGVHAVGYVPISCGV